jgi:OOP family OmpA-OmpF porin
MLTRWAARVVAGCLVLAGTAWAADEGKDHPALGRYPGATIRGYDFKEYEQAQFPLSKPFSKGGKVTADKLLPLEGRVTYLHYEAPPSTSTLQVFRNYQSALRRGGFKELFVCERPCGEQHFSHWGEMMKARRLYLNGGSEDMFFVTAQRDNTYVALAVTMVSTTPSVFEFVVETTALDDQKIAVVGNSAIAQGLAQGGKVDVYGFLFDTGKSQLKPDSAATLRELAQVLKDNPRLAVDVIGHTDDVGASDANLALSLARAQAVVAALTSEHGIQPTRLAALGKGATQPVAPNKTEDGRARNRRVEIVARSTAAAGSTVAEAQSPQAEPQPPAPVKEANAGKADSGDMTDKANKALDAARKLKSLFGR